MSSTNIKGSITVEAIVMLGLIATLTPILYKHVAERRQDIENINEANTLLLLKNATAEYIEANKETLRVGAVVLSPADIGVDISGYQIGIKKDSSGNVDALITGKAETELKAGKIAALLGVSAGIYSAQNTAKAWGINGVWAEDISNYGFASLPTGIPVITTAYDKEYATGLNEEQLKDFIENTGFDKITAKELCLNGECIVNWLGNDPIETIQNCNLGIISACKYGFQNEYNRSCQNIYNTYLNTGNIFTNGFFTLSSSRTAISPNQYCMCEDGFCYNASTIITNCNIAKNIENKFCQAGYKGKINTSCKNIITFDDSKKGQINTLTSATGVKEACCTDDAEFVIKETNTYEAISSISIANSANKTPPFLQLNNLCPGRYKIELRGESAYEYGDEPGTWSGGYESLGNSNGGILMTYLSIGQNELPTLVFKSISGYFLETSSLIAVGGSGIGVWINDEIKLVVGGGCATTVSGGGYTGGCGADQRFGNMSGYGYNGLRSPCNTSYCTNSNCSMQRIAWGGAWHYTNSSYGHGGSSFCGSGYICHIMIAGGNAPGHSLYALDTSGYVGFGNKGLPSVSVMYLGNE